MMRGRVEKCREPEQDNIADIGICLGLQTAKAKRERGRLLFSGQSHLPCALKKALFQGQVLTCVCLGDKSLLESPLRLAYVDSSCTEASLWASYDHALACALCQARW